MKSFYYIVCLLSVFHLHAVKEKKLETKLRRDYDLQLAHKQKAKELDKLAKVTVNKQTKAKITDQQKQEVKRPVILKQNNNRLFKNELAERSQYKCDCCAVVLMAYCITAPTLYLILSMRP